MEDKEIIHENWHQSANEALYWNKMANDKLSEIDKQLLTIAFVLLPLTASVLGLNINLNDVLKTILIGGWIFTFVSIICGFVHIIIEADFFRKYLDYNTHRSTIYHKNLDKTLSTVEAKIEKLQSPSASSGHLFLILQGISISIGLLLIMIVAGFLLIMKQ